MTGGSRGIGRGTALVLASEGYDVAITYSTQKEQAEQVAKAIRTQFERRCAVIQADMGREEVPARVVEDAIRELGGLEVLVNNAGITRFDANIVEDIRVMNELINLDFKGYLLAAFAAARHMVDHHIPGSIINITSTRAERAYPADAVYGGMKAALKRATETLALKYAPYGIRVNCVAPGAIRVQGHGQTAHQQDLLGKKIPLGRTGTPEDVGHAVAWLASEKASYVTGVTLRVDGGLILPGMPEHVSPDAEYGWGVPQQKPADVTDRK